MRIEFRKAELPQELRALVAFDHKIFPKADWFPPSYWKTCESYWMLVDGVKAGCSAFDLSQPFDDGLAVPGVLYLASTGILPKFQGFGLGRLMKAWQISYARLGGFRSMLTTTRKRNAAMIALNKEFGFRIVRSAPRYYADPTDAGVFMELRLKPIRK